MSAPCQTCTRCCRRRACRCASIPAVNSASPSRLVHVQFTHVISHSGAERTTVETRRCRAQYLSSPTLPLAHRQLQSSWVMLDGSVTNVSPLRCLLLNLAFPFPAAIDLPRILFPTATYKNAISSQSVYNSIDLPLNL